MDTNATKKKKESELLTKRQQEVFPLRADGYNNQEITALLLI